MKQLLDMGDNMKISTMIAVAILFWCYVAFCIYLMGKFAGAI
jgi:hypothetical protein